MTSDTPAAHAELPRMNSFVDDPNHHADTGIERFFHSDHSAGVLARIPFAFPRTPSPSPIGRVHWSVATVNDHGRLSDRSALKAVKWAPGQYISIDVIDGVALVERAVHSRWTIRSTGHLGLPASVRNRCSLMPDDRVPMAAVVDSEMILVYSAPLVLAALRAYSEAPFRGSREVR
ncbi:hypothetical protein [Nocardia sp. NPDC004123]